ncbi:GFA family protein [Rhodobacteraceae bacterium NNCM2]|nr:GFA family protein [Coraliihabitans acroporae]
MTLLTGGCMCGAVRYSVETPSELHYLCHCTDCQKHGGTAWHSAIVVAAADFTVTGETEIGTVTAESGRTIARHGCAKCHSHLFVTQWPIQERVSVKAGSLDDPAIFKPAFEIWTQSRVAWAPTFPGMTSYPKGFEGELPKWR